MARVVRKSPLALSSMLIIFAAVYGLAPMGAPSSAAAFAVSSAPAAQELRYGTGSWDAAKYGNHRAVVRVEAKADAVYARVPWRRRDTNPEKKNVVVVDAATGARVKNVCPTILNREYGDFVFQPSTAPGDYYFYYLTNTSKGSPHYPTVTYDLMELTADEGWLKTWGLAPFMGTAGNAAGLPPARVVEFQSIDDFNSFFPMEVVATAEEIAALVSQHPGAPYLLFPEGRRFPVRMKDDLPLRWVEAGPGNEFAGEALRGEYFTFQIGVFAGRQAIEGIEVAFEDMALIRPAAAVKPPGARTSRDKEPATRSAPMPSAVTSGPVATSPPSIPASGMSSFNTGGVDWDGRTFAKACAVPLGQVQPLWCGVQVPKEVPPGIYEGAITVRPKGLPQARIRLRLDVKAGILSDAGDSEPSRMSRLRWLDSRIAFDDGVVPPYTPLRVDRRTVSCLGRDLAVGGNGLPDRITSFFTPEVTGIGTAGRELLSSPVALIVQDAEGNDLPSAPGICEFTKPAPGAVAWSAESRSGPFTLNVQGRMESDGFVEFKVSVETAAAVDVSDIRLEIPLVRDAARYMMGLGHKGGLRPAEFAWAWDRTKNQDALWLGDVNGGLQVSLRDENYSRPLNTNFYLSKPLNLPPSWWNNGEGICAVEESSASTVLFTASSGPRRIPAHEPLHFNFNLLLTPFKPIDPGAHFATRFFHAFKPAAEAAGTGANTVNIHHATDINPYINYPFLRPADMKSYVDEAHARGLKVKIYYTIRELSNRAAELFALRSLGGEIFSPARAAGSPGSRSTWPRTISPPGSCPSSRTRPSSTAACPAGTIITSRGSTGWSRTSGSTASISTTSPSTGRP